MIGRITKLRDDAQAGTIAGEDGSDYTFTSLALLGMTFGMLHLGAGLTFVADPVTKHATLIRFRTDAATQG